MQQHVFGAIKVPFGQSIGDGVQIDGVTHCRKVVGGGRPVLLEECCMGLAGVDLVKGIFQSCSKFVLDRKKIQIWSDEWRKIHGCLDGLIGKDIIRSGGCRVKSRSKWIQLTAIRHINV